MNKTEEEFAKQAALDGWIVTKRGWPDFICRRGLQVMAVEVKEKDWLSPEQDAAMRDLAVVGLATFVWTKKGGFRPYPDTPVDALPSRLELYQQVSALQERLTEKAQEVESWKARYRSQRKDALQCREKYAALKRGLRVDKVA